MFAPGRWCRPIPAALAISATVARFELRETHPNAAVPQAARAAWTVDATATAANGQTTIYRLTYEPFGGRLVRLEKGGAQ